MTQINIRIWKSLGKRFSNATKNAFLRRDAFLANVLRHELPTIDEELAGLLNTDQARRFIAQRLELTPRTDITLALPRDVVALLKEVCGRHNLVRDALFNRLFFFLSYSPELVARILLMSEKGLQALGGEDVMGKEGKTWSFDFDWIRPIAVPSTTPLQLARQLVMSPLDPYRALLDILQNIDLDLAGNNPLDWKDTTLSSLSFCDAADRKKKPCLAGLNLYVPEGETPGTDAYWTRHPREKIEHDRMLQEIDAL